MVWRIQGTISYRDGQWSQNTQLPTFLIDSDFNGATCAETALKIARWTVDPFKRAEMVSLTAYCEETGEYADKVWKE